MLLRWVNHASFILEHGDIRFLSDPWTAGSAFANGWDLLSPTALSDEALSRVTHIWYSHEHPDHFAPRVLKAIPPEARAQITVLYQATKDRKVLAHCEQQGFRVRALRDGEAVELSAGFRITCGQVPFYDSWLLVEADGHRILNLNDCVVDRPEIAMRIRKAVGDVDVLMSQFNDAEWKGNPDETERRTAAATEMLARLAIQARVFRPKFMLPFASYFYFSHEENFYLNDRKNQIGDVARFVEQSCEATPVVLYPDDTWEVGRPHDAGAACRRYEADVAAAKPIHTPGQTIALDELRKLADAYRARIRAHNNAALLWLASNSLKPMLPKVVIELWDTGELVEFDWRRGLQGSTGSADISMHSESLAFVFKFDWGMDTLTVNGRFRATRDGYQRFIAAFAPGSLNNMGLRLGFGLLTNRPFLKRLLAMRG
jgi:hypothetical protein